MLRRNPVFRTEAAERASLVDLVLVSAAGGTATLRNLATNHVATVRVGDAQWGWEILLADSGSAVIEHDFDEWSELRFLWAVRPTPKRQQTLGSGRNIAVRKPVGDVAAMSQPTYDFAAFDPQYHCKQDIDPADWMGRLAANMSGGEEASPQAANTLMAQGLQHHFEPHLTDVAAPRQSSRAARRALPGGDACGMLIGAYDPML